MAEPNGVTDFVGGKAKTLLLVPGLGSDWRVWGGFADRLRHHFQVVHVNYPGHGGLPLPATPIDPVAAVDEAASQILGTPAVIALGAGTTGGVRLAKRRQAWALVLFSPSPGVRLPEVQVDYEAVLSERLQEHQWASDIAAITDPEERRRAWVAHLGPMLEPMIEKGVTKHDFDQILAMYVENIDPMTAIAKSGHPAREEDWGDDLTEVDVPALVVSAAGEEIPVRVAEAVAARLPRGQLILLESAVPGMPWLADPVNVSRKVVDFLRACH